MDGRGVGISTQKVTRSLIGTSSLSKMVRAGFLRFEEESKKCIMVKEEIQVDTKKIN